MNTELDRVKSTITISLGLKNRLRDAKGSASYEECIAQLLRTRNERAHKDNYIELQKFQRKEKVYSFDEYKIVFSYNKYNQSENFVFDIHINNMREEGRNILSISFGNEQLQFGYALYFELLTLAIQTEREPLFKHKGRFEDYYLWQKEFERLGLSKKAFENDVMEKLNEYKSGVYFT
ncbi:MAG: hypothetical protein V1743_04860 [Nanoarchaeota archaeon]